ncbi:MAG: hypothetical protein MPJ24_06920 [Pirellulaceae bacterium]|nr:hypothetical protein [Pirellulaceae bacterium]
MIGQNEFIVGGEGPLAQAIAKTLAMFLGRERVKYTSTEEETLETIRSVGLNFEKRVATHLISVLPLKNSLSDDVMFRQHCRFRKKEAMSYWEGAILFVGREKLVKNGIQKKEDFFQKLGNSHHVEFAPLNLVSFLKGVARAEPLYFADWQQTFFANGELAEMKRVLQDFNLLKNPPDEYLSQLKNVIDQVLSSDLFSRLLTHHETLHKLKKLRASMNEEALATPRQLLPVVKRLREIVENY